MLVRKAEELQALCIVMATHNKGRLKEFFLGSVTQYVMHHSRQVRTKAVRVLHVQHGSMSCVASTSNCTDDVHLDVRVFISAVPREVQLLCSTSVHSP